LINIAKEKKVRVKNS